MSISGSGFSPDRPYAGLGPDDGPAKLSPVPVVVTIRTDRTGAIDIAVSGPIKGRAGLLALLDAARQIAAAMRDEWPLGGDPDWSSAAEMTRETGPRKGGTS